MQIRSYRDQKSITFLDKMNKWKNQSNLAGWRDSYSVTDSHQEEEVPDIVIIWPLTKETRSRGRWEGSCGHEGNFPLQSEVHHLLTVMLQWGKEGEYYWGGGESFKKKDGKSRKSLRGWKMVGVWKAGQGSEKWGWQYWRTQEVGRGVRHIIKGMVTWGPGGISRLASVLSASVD